MWTLIISVLLIAFYLTDGYLAIGNKWLKFSWSALRAKKRNVQIKTYFYLKKKIKNNPKGYDIAHIKRMYDGGYLSKKQCEKLYKLWCNLMNYDLNITL